MRKDAQQNRERLIAAASDVMRTTGGDVSMETIAERAGVTRGTLYRNFSHRQAIYEAVLEHDMVVMADDLEIEGKDDPLAFIRLLTTLMVVYDKFLVSLTQMDDYDKEKSEARMISVFAKSLNDAKQKGILRKNLTGQDILIVCRMLASHSRLEDPNDLPGNFKQRLRLLLSGLALAPRQS